MVGKKSKIERRETDINSNPRFDNSIHCSKNGRLGAHFQGLTTKFQWNKEEKNLHINRLELKAVKLAIIDLTRLKAARGVQMQWQGDKNQRSELNILVNQAISNKQSNNDYCRVSTNFSQCLSGLGVTTCPGLQ